MGGCRGCLGSILKIAGVAILIAGTILVGATSLWHQNSPSLGRGLILVGGTILLLLVEGLLALRFWMRGSRAPALIMGAFMLVSFCGLCGALTGGNTAFAELAKTFFAWLVEIFPNPYR
jgi:hypothetical protein